MKIAEETVYVQRNAQPSLRRLCKLYLIALSEKPEHNAARWLRSAHLAAVCSRLINIGLHSIYYAAKGVSATVLASRHHHDVATAFA